MIGRGTRIDEESGKLMFWIFDYTGATTLFGADLITPPPTSSRRRRPRCRRRPRPSKSKM
jgi:type I site-specific restriction endonuclease